MRSSLLSALSPAYSSGCISIGLSGISGRSFHISARGSKFVLTVIPPSFRSSEIRLSVSFALITIPSTPTQLPPLKLSFLPSHFEMLGVSSKPSFISTKPVPSSCSAAAMKYLESVQRAASLRVTTAVPAEPLKPDIHSRHFQWSGTYSPLCGSVLGKMNASMLSRRITSRRAEILSGMFIVLFSVKYKG